MPIHSVRIKPFNGQKNQKNQELKNALIYDQHLSK
jgi:hypothetical protein